MMSEVVNFSIVLFKSMEWFFWSAVVVCGFHLVFTRLCFDSMVRFINWIFRIHEFDGAIAGNAKAYKRFHRDMVVLFVLNMALVVMIRVI